MSAKHTPCKHPPPKLFSWFAFNCDTGKKDIWCVVCTACNTVLRGGRS